jgi:hypothetical protein
LVSENGTSGCLWVRVQEFAPALGAEADASRLSFNVEAWRSILRRRAVMETQLRLQQPLQVVGWAHGHPSLPQTGDSPLFLSPQDIAITAQHFAEPFACALLFDAQAQPAASLEDSLMAYGWDQHGICLVPRSLDLAGRSGR